MGGKITGVGGHVRRGTGVEVPVRRALRVMWDAGRVQSSVEAPGVEGVVGDVWRRWLKVRGHHRLLRLERRSQTQDPRAGSAERHRPCLATG